MSATMRMDYNHQNRFRITAFRNIHSAEKPCSHNESHPSLRIKQYSLQKNRPYLLKGLELTPQLELRGAG